MPIGGWEVFEKQSGGKGYEKYDAIYALIVGRSKKPHVLYFSKKAYEDMGKPDWVQIRFNGSEVGFFPAKEEEPNAYKIAFTGDDHRSGRAFINSRAVVEATNTKGKRKLKSGVYMAQMHNNQPTKVLVINSNDEPSYL